MGFVCVAVCSAIRVVLDYRKVKRSPRELYAEFLRHVCRSVSQGAASIKVEVIIRAEVRHVAARQRDFGNNLVELPAIIFHPGVSSLVLRVAEAEADAL